MRAAVRFASDAASLRRFDPLARFHRDLSRRLQIGTGRDVVGIAARDWYLTGGRGWYQEAELCLVSLICIDMTEKIGQSVSFDPMIEIRESCKGDKVDEVAGIQPWDSEGFTSS